MLWAKITPRKIFIKSRVCRTLHHCLLRHLLNAMNYCSVSNEIIMKHIGYWMTTKPNKGHVLCVIKYYPGNVALSYTHLLLKKIHDVCWQCVSLFHHLLSLHHINNSINNLFVVIQVIWISETYYRHNRPGTILIYFSHDIIVSALRVL